VLHEKEPMYNARVPECRAPSLDQR